MQSDVPHTAADSKITNVQRSARCLCSTPSAGESQRSMYPLVGVPAPASMLSDLNYINLRRAAVRDTLHETHGPLETHTRLTTAPASTDGRSSLACAPCRAPWRRRFTPLPARPCFRGLRTHGYRGTRPGAGGQLFPTHPHPCTESAARHQSHAASGHPGSGLQAGPTRLPRPPRCPAKDLRVPHLPLGAPRPLIAATTTASAPPTLAPYAWDCPSPIVLARAAEAARHVVGEHDFTSFAAADPDQAARRLNPKDEAASNIRTIFRSEWCRERPSPGVSRHRIRLSSPHGTQPGGHLCGSGQRKARSGFDSTGNDRARQAGRRRDGAAAGAVSRLGRVPATPGHLPGRLRRSRNRVPRREGNMTTAQTALSQHRITRLAAQLPVHRAFHWLHLQQTQLRLWQLEFLAIPAPPFGESERGSMVPRPIPGARPGEPAPR